MEIYRNKKDRIGRRENKYQNGRCKFRLISNYIKYKWLRMPIKRQRFTEWIKRHDPNIFCVKNILYKFKETNRWKVKV